MKLRIIILLSALSPLLGQVSQSHPEYCGIPGGINPPLPDISVNIDGQGDAVLFFGQGNSTPGIPLTAYGLPSLIREVTEVCPLSDGRLVLFGDYGGTAVFIIDPKSRSLVDSFDGYSPVISPDQHWIVFIKPYPLHGVIGSDQPMLYDLTKTPAENRPYEDKSDPGRVIYPPGRENSPGSNINLPDSLRHMTGSPFYWAPDSRAILFMDGDNTGSGIVLVSLDEKGHPSALRHNLTAEDACGSKVSNGAMHGSKMERVEIGPPVSGKREILFDITPLGDNRCVSHILRLHSEDFHPAKVEAHEKPAYTRGAILDGKEVIPPKKK
jgi:hypothetical protein